MSINTSIGLVGVALQNGPTPATEPEYKHGLTGGGIISPERTIEQQAIACGMRANASNSSYVSEVNMGVDFETAAYANALGLYLYATCGNVESTAAQGKEGYYKHVITLGSILPLLTFWGQVGATEDQTVHRVDGAKMDTLSLTFEGNAPLTIGVTAAGVDAALFGSWTDVVAPSCFDGYFVPTNGEFLIDTASQTPAAATITGGSFELSNSLTSYRGAGQVLPSQIAESKMTTNVSNTVIPDDWALIRKMLTGSSTGTEVTASIVYGSCKWTFTHTADPNCSLVVEFANVPWNCEMPEVDPEGGAAEIEFSADDVGISSADGSPVTITLTNKVESYAPSA